MQHHGSKREGIGPISAALAAVGSAMAGVAVAHFEWSWGNLRPRLLPHLEPESSWLQPRTNAYKPASAWQLEATDALTDVVAGLILLAAAIALLALVTLALTRYSRRKREYATRSALGASPFDVLGTVGRAVGRSCALGLAIGSVIAWLVIVLVQSRWPGVIEGTLWVRAALALAGATGFAVVAFVLAVGGIWLFALRTTMARALSVGSRATADLGETRFRELAAGLQVAGCVVLLVAASMLSARRDRPAEERMTLHDLQVARLEQRLPSDNAERARAFGRLLVRVHAMSGVQAESIASAGAVTGIGPSDRIYSECDRCKYMQPPLPFRLLTPRLYSVGPGFLGLTRRELLRGRDFGASDNLEGERVVIVNERFAILNFATNDPLNRVIRLRDGFGTLARIIGVVADQPGIALGSPSAAVPVVYVSAFQFPPENAELLVRTRSGEAPPIDGLKFVAAAVLRAQAAAPYTFIGWCVRALAIVCLLLAAQGLYATIRALIESTRSELGVRSALGATAGSVVRLLLFRNAKIALVGAAFGAVASLAAQALLQQALPGAPTYGKTVIGAAALLLLITLAATLLPAIRVARAPAIESA